MLRALAVAALIVSPNSSSSRPTALQAPSPPVRSLPLQATRYDSVFDDLVGLKPVPGKMGFVQHVTLRRDVARFTLDSGYLAVLTPVRGRTVAAVFIGQGSFSFAPPTRVEQEQLNRFYQTRAIEQPFERLFLLFADSTAAELEAALQANPRMPIGVADVAGIAHEALRTVSHRGRRYFDSDLMTAFLNDEHNELFFARISDIKDGPFLFEVDPYETEEVMLLRGARGETGGLTDDPIEIISQFHWPGTMPGVSRRVSRLPTTGRSGSGSATTPSTRPSRGTTTSGPARS